MDDQKKYADLLLDRKVNSLILKRSYIAFRHKDCCVCKSYACKDEKVV